VTKDTKATTSSGNVVADLGFANPEGEPLKAKLVREIRGIIRLGSLRRPRPLTWAEAAGCFGACHRSRRRIFDRASGSMLGSTGLQGRPRGASATAPRCFASSCGLKNSIASSPTHLATTLAVPPKNYDGLRQGSYRRPRRTSLSAPRFAARRCGSSE
jgi:hypothetical protein